MSVSSAMSYCDSSLYSEFMRIKYVTVPVKRRTISPQSSAKWSKAKVESRLFGHWEYESILESRTQNELWFWPEWF